CHALQLQWVATTATQSRNDTAVSDKSLTPVCRLAMTIFPAREVLSGCLKDKSIRLFTKINICVCSHLL
ncbi:MAG: hypothetical protein II131_04645, partial [Neisseriaceae bacterium]|nr:hypothetical protein [Neisseriaceae bacterium]